MDLLERAQQEIDLAMEVLIKNTPGVSLISTSKCLYCQGPISSGAFCDAGCRDDFEKLDVINAQKAS